MFKSALIGILLILSGNAFAGYTVDFTSPVVVIAGKKYAAGAFVQDSPVGQLTHVGLFVENSPNDWNEIFTYAIYTSGLLADINAKGGMDGYVTAMISAENRYLLEKFSATTPPVTPSGVPTTDEEALRALIVEIMRLRFTIVNGVPVLGR